MVTSGNARLTTSLMGMSGAFILALWVFSSAMVVPSTASAASGSTERFTTTDEISKILPEKLSQNDLMEAKEIALNDDKVKDIIGEKSYEFMSYDFIGNVYEEPVIWLPEVHFKIGDKTQITAVVDLTEGKVREIVESEIVVLSNHERSFAIDYFTGGQTVTGYYMIATAPDFTGSSGNDFTAFLVNGVMDGSTIGNLCDSADYPDDYWAQTGLLFTTSGASVVWTDTSKDCAAQTTAISYDSDVDYNFKIYTDAANEDWIIYMQNTDTGTASTVIVSGPSTYTFETNEPNSGVFFENSNASPNNTWDNQFSSDPTASAYYRQQGSSFWWIWSAESQILADCNGVDTDNVIDGGFISTHGNQATWDMTDMANYYAC